MKLSDVLTFVKGIADGIWVSHVAIFGYNGEYF